MKNILFVFLTFISLQTLAQKNAFKFAPLQLAAGKIDLTYERKTARKTSFLLNVQSISKTNHGNAQRVFFPLLTAVGGRTVTTKKGTAIDLSLRQYFGKSTRMNGFYLQGGLRFGQQKVTTRQEGGLASFLETPDPPKKSTEDLAGLHLRTGWQWTTPGGFNFDLGLGGGSYFSQDDGFFIFNCKLGYAF